MLSDSELHNYLNELGVLGDKRQQESSLTSITNESLLKEEEVGGLERTIEKERWQSSQDSLDELVSQIIALSSLRRESDNSPIFTKKKSSFQIMSILMCAIFTSGIISGFFISSLRQTSMEKLTSDLQRAIKSFEALDFERLNPPPIQEEIIEDVTKNQMHLTL